MMADERKFSFKFRNSAERNAALAFLKAHEPSFDVHTPSVTDVIVTDDACESLKTFLRRSRGLSEGDDFEIRAVKNITEFTDPAVKAAIRSSGGRRHPYNQTANTVLKLAHTLARSLKSI
jgi:hypothetical protein